ncbi:hypothetical protein QQ045_030013 [Rhodiola kirilowii]
MRALTWNYRGLGNARAVRALTDLVKAHGPQVVGLIETKVEASRVRRIQTRLGFQQGLAVDRRGLGGGLAIWWTADIQLDIRSFLKNHIDAWVGDDDGFRLSISYGNPMTRRSADTWNLLRALNEDKNNEPWVT